MVQFPSNLRFVSFIRYSPQGTSDLATTSREICYAIKRDGLVALPNPTNGRKEEVRAIQRAALRIEALFGQFPLLSHVLGPEVSLVPIPRSAPIKPGTLWPAERICRALHAQGLAADVLPFLERIKAVHKSSTAAPKERATPEVHYESLRAIVSPTLIPPRRITIVDDVITRGATFLGAYPHVAAAFPGIPIYCFAIVRTDSYKEIESIVDPIEGTISMRHGQPHREP